MITVPEAVEEIIRRSPFLEEALSSGIINLSSLARQIQPQIKEKLLKNIQSGAVIMALKRLSTKLNRTHHESKALLYRVGDLTVRSNLVEFTFSNSGSLLDRLREVLLNFDREKNAFITFTHGTHETTLIISSSLEEEVEKIFIHEHLRSKFTQLSAISLLLPQENVNTPGLYYHILKNLAWNNINIIEVASNYTELTIILEDKDVEKAFSALKGLS